MWEEHTKAIGQPAGDEHMETIGQPAVCILRVSLVLRLFTHWTIFLALLLYRRTKLISSRSQDMAVLP